MTRWIELEGTNNTRDLGGLPLIDGRVTQPSRLLRSDNLQDLSERDLTVLLDEHSVTDVLDLRTRTERELEGPTRLDEHDQVSVRHLSLLPEELDRVRTLEGEAIMPWSRQAGEDVDEHVNARYRRTSDAGYAGYLAARADSVVEALRVIAAARGAALAHCAAGKDRTGVVVAVALELVGVPREAILADYLQTRERVPRIVAQLLSRPTYAASLRGRPIESHMPDPAAMHAVFAELDAVGGAYAWASGRGWDENLQTSLRAKLTN